MKSFKDIDIYIANHSKEVQVLLKKIRVAIKKSAPKAKETISYGIPTFVLNGNLVHFGVFKKHLGFFPGPSGVSSFKKELSDYKTSKGTIQFPFNKPLPVALIRKIVAFRVKENQKK